jgi:hypothetical protein
VSTPNKFGLSRSIPEPVKRAVRQRCGFGCVLCGCCIVEYEHFAPPYAEARAHDPAGICLLCPTCHARKTRNLLSERRVREAAATPKCIEQGFSFGELEHNAVPPCIVFCGSLFLRCTTPIAVNGWPLLSIEEPEAPHAPNALSASFFDLQGRPSLLLRKNEWVVLTEQWDVELVSNTVTVRQGAGSIGLRLAFLPGTGIVVDRLAMSLWGYRFQGDAGSFTVTDPSGSAAQYRAFTIADTPTGMDL